MPKATNTHSCGVVLIDFLQQQWLPEYASILRYTYIACLVNRSVCGLKLGQLASGMKLPTSGDVAWSWGDGFRRVSIFRGVEGGMSFLWVSIPKCSTSHSVRLKFRCSRMLSFPPVSPQRPYTPPSFERLIGLKIKTRCSSESCAQTYYHNQYITQKNIILTPLISF